MGSHNKFTGSKIYPDFTVSWNQLSRGSNKSCRIRECAERRNPACILCRFSINWRSLSSYINDYLVPFSCSLSFSLSAGLAIIDSAFEHLQAPVLIAQGLAPTLTHLDEPWNLKVGSPVDILLSLQYTRYTLTFCSLDEMKKGY